MSEVNNLNNLNNSEEKEDNYYQTNDEFTHQIFELEIIIKEKEDIINTLYSKIKEFSLNIEQLKIENEKLKSQLMFIEKEIKKNKSLFNDNLIIQPTQRFKVYKNITNISNNILGNNYISNNNIGNLNNNILNQNSNININDIYFNDNYIYNNDNIKTDYINQNFKSVLIPFQMKPFQKFDHKKLYFKYNSIIYDNKDESILFNNKTPLNKIKDDNCCISCLKKIEENNLNIEENNNKINKNSENSNNTKKEIKLHSSMFFQNCKKVISKNEYKKLLEIVKLSNLKKISKEDTYLKITSLLDNNYPELSKQFKLLFI